MVNIILLADDWPNCKRVKDRFVPSGNDVVIPSDDAQMYDYFSEKDGFTRGEVMLPATREGIGKRVLAPEDIDRIYKLLEREGL